MVFAEIQWRALFSVGLAAFASLLSFRLAQDGNFATGKMFGTFGLVITFFLSSRYLDLLQAKALERELEQHLSSRKDLLLNPGEVKLVSSNISAKDYLLWGANSCIFLKIEDVSNNANRANAARRIAHAATGCRSAVVDCEQFLVSHNLKQQLQPVLLLSRRHIAQPYRQEQVLVTDRDHFYEQIQALQGLSATGRKSIERLFAD